MPGCLISQIQNFIKDTNIPFMVSYHRLCMDDCYYMCPFCLLSTSIGLVRFFGRGIVCFFSVIMMYFSALLPFLVILVYWNIFFQL